MLSYDVIYYSILDAVFMASDTAEPATASVL